MAVNLDQFNKLKKAVDEAEAEANRAEGALGTLMARLAAEHGCSTLKQADQHLDDLEADAEEKEAAYANALKTFEEEWAGKAQMEGSDG